jgi:threonyl-tRNA synthetase
VGFLIEHYGGNFPLWLSPVQVKIVPVGEAHEAYAKKLEQELRKSFVRVEVARAVDTLGKRIRAAETMKIPLILVVGDKEIEANAVNVRTRGKKETETIPFATFLENVEKQIKERAS